MDFDELLRFKKLDPDVRAALEHADQLQRDLDEMAEKLERVKLLEDVLEALDDRIAAMQPDTVASGLISGAFMLLGGVD